jgi:S1-C subfamily serine protease
MVKGLRGLLLVALVFNFASCEVARPSRPEEPVEVLAARSIVSSSWETVARIAAPTVVGIHAEHGLFVSPAQYGSRWLGVIRELISNPISGIVELLSTLFVGYLDLESAEGTGLVVAVDGRVLTNAHVVSEAETIDLYYADGRVRAAHILAISTGHDLALLGIEATRNEEPFSTPRFRDPRALGEEMALLGFPARPFDNGSNPVTLTRGLVSSLNIDVGELSRRFQSDAASNPGSSGSPALGRDAAVLGLVTEHSRPAAFEDQTFIIPSGELEKAGFIKITGPRAGQR